MVELGYKTNIVDGTINGGRSQGKAISIRKDGRLSEGKKKEKLKEMGFDDRQIEKILLGRL